MKWEHFLLSSFYGYRNQDVKKLSNLHRVRQLEHGNKRIINQSDSKVYTIGPQSHCFVMIKKNKGNGCSEDLESSVRCDEQRK